MDPDSILRVNKPNKLHLFNNRPCGHNAGKRMISIKLLKMAYRTITTVTPVSSSEDPSGSGT